MPFPRSRFIVMMLLAALLAGAVWWVTTPIQVEDVPPEISQDDAAKPLVGLMGTLPIYWGEVAGVDELLQGEGSGHWARSALERRYRLEPLDTIDGERGVARLDRLILAQPRALSGPENVALDNWVRAGGRLLIFADPFLSGESRFHIGDRRRPQDVVLISPILARWGLDLKFDEEQADGLREEKWGDVALPVALAGHFEPRDPAGGAESRCELLAEGLVARCAIGAGGALLVADATLIENGDVEAGRSQSLLALAKRAFESDGEKPGKSRE